MSAIPKVKSKETEVTSSGSHEKIPVKDIFSNIQSPVITNPIDPTRTSKELTNGLSISSAVKAGLVFLGTVGFYYLTKTGFSSYFGWKAKAKNSKDVGNSEIMEVKTRADALSARTNLETARQVVNNPLVGQTVAAHKDRTVKFEEVKVEEFENSPEVKGENMGERRSISVQNPIPNQNVIVGKLFELTIDGNNVFSSSSASNSR